MTPTSGAAPYVLSADIANAVNIDGVNYTVYVGSGTSVGTCPATGLTALPAGQVDELLATGSVTINESVASGSCRTYTLRINRVSDGTNIAASHINIDNV